MALLKVLHGLGNNLGQEIALERAQATLGRHPSCDIKLEDGSVSREHARISLVAGRYYIEDLNSRNGTYVNGELIRGRRQLADTDLIKICDLQFSFHQQNAPSGTLPMSASATLNMLVDDSNEVGSATIMSKLDLSQSSSGLRWVVKPEAKLQAMMQITENLSKALALEEVLLKTLDSLFQIFPQADRGFIVLRETEGGPLIPKAVKVRRGDPDSIRISRTVVRHVLEAKEAILSADAATDARFDLSQSIADFHIRSIMCAPLIAADNVAIGVLEIDTTDQRSRFQQEDLDVLASVARQAAFAVENARLHEMALAQQRLENDLALAHRVQQGFLPSAPPQLVGYQFFDHYEPAYELGGDYYDYIPLPGGRLAVVVADVSGKGAAAALLMARLASETRFYLAGHADPAEAVNRLSESFERGGWEDRFVTMIVAVIDPAENQVTVVNAGHMPPFFRDAQGKIQSIGEEESGLPLGIDGTWVYQAARVSLAAGESLLVFTDGLSEAMNPTGELYGLKRLAEQISTPADDIRHMGQGVLDAIKAFVSGRAQSDDMCLACFGRTK